MAGAVVDGGFTAPAVVHPCNARFDDGDLMDGAEKKPEAPVS